MRSKRLSAFAATFLSVAAFAAFNPPQYTNTYTSGGVTYAQFGGVKSSNYVATAVANLWMASNYVDAVASEFEDGTRTVRDAQVAGDASSAGTSYYLAGDSWEDQYNADDLIRASTNAAIAVSGTLEGRLTNGYLKVASARNADTATSADTAQNADNVAWDANGNYMSGSEIYARVMEDVPRPGNYSAVSNAAMNARSMTDLGVRGAPGPYVSGWFTVNGDMFAQNDAVWQNDRYPFAIVSSFGDMSYYLSGSDDVDFTLSDNFSATAVYEGVSYSIVGYTNTLAQVSQIPEVPSASDATPLMDRTASAGTTNAFARGDHRHPSDTSKLDGASAYPAWFQTPPTPYVVGQMVSNRGLIWKCTEAGTTDEPGVSELGWEEMTIGSLLSGKQDALPYPTNAIPYAAISGAPSLAGQTFDFSRNYDIIRATAAIAEALGATVTNNPTAQGGN